MNAHLLAFVFAFDGGALLFRARLQAVAADALEVRDHPTVRNLGLGVRLGGRQVAEEGPPLQRHAVRGGKPSLVHGFDVGRIDARQMRAGAHAFKVGFRHGLARLGTLPH